MTSDQSYPKEIVTIEKITTDSAETRVVTVVNNEYEEKAVKAAMGFMDAFNNSDVKTAGAHINYPHARVGAEGKLVVREDTDHLMAPGFFEWFKENTQWNHSCWDFREVIQSKADKVHIKVQFSRYRTDGSKIGVYPSLWVMTNQDGHWGIKMRSSFAM